MNIKNNAAQANGTQTKRFVSSVVMCVLASLGLGQAANAQTVQGKAVSLPLSSVGKEVGWKINPDNFRLAISDKVAGEPFALEIYSPEINRNDYANKRNRETYYGDEVYAKDAKVSSQWTLAQRGGQVLAKKTYGFGDRHSTDVLYDTDLLQGYYPLEVVTSGNGKNAYSYRLPAGFAIEASQFTVLARGELNKDQLAARFTINQSGVGKKLLIENYDADGTKEMLITLVRPDGKRVALNSSPDAKWDGDGFEVTPTLTGEYAILVKILPTTKQFSNSVVFRLKLGNEPYYARVALSGAAQPKPKPAPIATLRVDAQTVFCGKTSALSNVAFSLTGTGGTQSLRAPAQVTLAPGEYSLQLEGVAGATSAPVKVMLKNGETQNATLQYAAQAALQLSPANIALTVGETASVTASASTDYPYALPLQLGVTLPSGVSSSDPASIKATISKGKPATLTMTVRGDQAGSGAIVAALEAECKLSAQSNITVSAKAVPPAPPAPAKLTLEKTVDRDLVKLGETVNFTLTASNVGGTIARDIDLSDALPKGLSGQNFKVKFDLEPGQVRRFNVQGIVNNDAKGIVVNTAFLVGNNQSLQASANVRVEAPVVVTPPPPAPTPPPPAPAPAKLALEKTVDRNVVKSGEKVNFTITASNVGGSIARNVKLSDALPGGLTGANLEQSFDLAPGESKRFNVAAIVANDARGVIVNTAYLNGNNETLAASATVTVQGILAAARRESTVTVTGQLNGQNFNCPGNVILSDKIPANSSYVPGSSVLILDPTLDATLQTPKSTTKINDPYISGDRYFWVLPYNAKIKNYGIAYKLAHTDVLVNPKDRVGLLVSQNCRNARNGEGFKLGELVLGDVRVLQGDAGILESFRNAKRMDLDTQPAPQSVGGNAAKIAITPERPLCNDMTDRPTLRVTVSDKDGKPANDQFVTLFLQPESIQADAAPELPGYQAALKNGVALVQLDSLEFASSVFAEARIGEIAYRTELPVCASKRSFVAVGVANLNFSVRAANWAFSDPSTFTIGAGINAFARGNVFGDWLLTAAVNFNAGITSADNFNSYSWINFNNTLLPPANPFDRFPVLGDAAQTGSDVQSGTPFYIRLENGPSYVMYGRTSAGFAGITTAYSPAFDGVRGELRGDNYYVNAFLNTTPITNASEVFKADGTDQYRLSGKNTSYATPSPNVGVVGVEISPSSEQLVVVTTDKDDKTVVLGRRILTRGQDYTIDYIAGVVRLSFLLQPVDANGRPQYLEARYATVNTTVFAALNYGAQAGVRFGQFGIEATGLRFGPNSRELFGAALIFNSDNLRGRIEGTYSSAPALAAAIEYANGNFGANLSYQERFPGYIDPNSNTTLAGSRDINAGVRWAFSSSVALTAGLNHNQAFGTPGASTGGNAALRFTFGNFGFNIGADARYVDTGSSKLTKLWGTAGLNFSVGNFNLSAVQRVPFMGDATTYGDTAITLDYSLSQNFGVYARDTLTYEWNGIRNQVAFGMRGRFTNRELVRGLGGNLEEIPNVSENLPSSGTPQEGEEWGFTNVAAGYELDSVSGDQGRFRVGLDTTIPLSKGLAVQLGSSADYAPASNALNASIGTGLLFKSDTLQGNVRAQFSFQPNGLKQVYSAAAVWRPGDGFVLSPSIEYSVEPVFNSQGIRDGGRFSLAGAYRADDWTVLTNHTGRFGLYQPDRVQGDQIEGEIQFGYNANERLFLRAGAGYRYAFGTNALTAQIGAGATWYLTDFFGLGANAVYRFQVPSNSSSLAFGLEGSLRLLPGFVTTLGVNLFGFDNLGNGFNTTPGFYLRFDWKFDENTFGAGR